MVAKSYKDLEILTDPYTINGKNYVKVRTKKGEPKQVRWYTEAEYKKMYPESEASTDRPIGNSKTVLGFSKGYITILKGDAIPWADWLRASAARYARPWGWYFPSEITVPPTLPVELTPIKLTWEEVSTNDVLNPEDKIRAYVDTLVYESQGEHIGTIGERLALTLTVTATHKVDSNFGTNTMHVFNDADGNVFTWTTGAKTLTVGTTYNLKGTVKDHKIFKGVKQTVLTRCTIQ